MNVLSNYNVGVALVRNQALGGAERVPVASLAPAQSTCYSVRISMTTQVLGSYQHHQLHYPSSATPAVPLLTYQIATPGTSTWLGREDYPVLRVKGASLAGQQRPWVCQNPRRCSTPPGTCPEKRLSLGVLHAHTCGRRGTERDTRNRLSAECTYK